MSSQIVVGTDGSTSADSAVDRAFEEAENAGGTVHALFVVDTTMFDEPGLSSAELATSEMEDFGQDRLAEIAEKGNHRGVEVRTHCCHGKPHEELIEYADGVDATMIVLGHQGQSNRGKNHIGSVTDRVIRSTGRQVLLV